MKRVRGRSLAAALWILVCAAAPAFGSGLKADFDGNGVVDLEDFFLFAAYYGQTIDQAGFDARFDLIGNGSIDQEDYSTFAVSFGKRTDEPTPPGPRKTFLYVADYPDNGVSILDSGSNLVLSYIPFRAPSGIAVSRDQRSTYIVDSFTFLVLQDDFRVDYTLPVRGGARVVLSPDERLAFVSQDQANSVLFVDLERKAALDTVDVGLSPFGMAVSPDGRTLYVVNTLSSNSALSIIDVQRRTVRDSVVLSTVPGLIVVSPDGRRGFLNSATGGTVTVIDLTNDRVIGSIQTGQSKVYGMDLSPDGKRLYVAAAGSVFFIDAERNLILDRVAIAEESGPLRLSPDGSRIYTSAFSNSAGGTGIYILDVATKQSLGKIKGFGFPIDLAFRTSSADVPASFRNKPAASTPESSWTATGTSWYPRLTRE